MLNANENFFKILLCWECSINNMQHFKKFKNVTEVYFIFSTFGWQYYISLLSQYHVTNSSNLGLWASNTFIHSIMTVLYTLRISNMQLQTEKHTFNIRIEKLS